MSEVDEFSYWAQSRNVGCFFARAMFKASQEYGISVMHVSGSDGVTIAHALDAAIKKEIENPLSEAGAFVFDRNLPVTEYARLLRTLGGLSDWYLRETQIKFETRDFAIIGLDTLVGQDHGVEALSEVVGFAPYNYLPITRRAPVPAFVLRTKPTFSEDPLPDRTERRANLAAIRLNIAPNAFSKLWAKSQELRAELDGKNHPMARARVALAFPSQVWAVSEGKIAAPRNAKNSA